MDNVKDDKYYLSDMLTNIDHIQEISGGISVITLNLDTNLYNSVLMYLLNIGNDVIQLTDDFKYHYDYIPWNKIRGLRHRIAHDYAGIDSETIYSIVKDDIPVLRSFIEEHLAEE